MEVKRGETAETAMLRIKKFCPECVKAGRKSRITVGPTSRPSVMSAPAWYDEDGDYHPRDQLKVTTQYKCSNGHKWAETE